MLLSDRTGPALLSALAGAVFLLVLAALLGLGGAIVGGVLTIGITAFVLGARASGVALIAAAAAVGAFALGAGRHHSSPDAGALAQERQQARSADEHARSSESRAALADSHARGLSRRLAVAEAQLRAAQARARGRGRRAAPRRR